MTIKLIVTDMTQMIPKIETVTIKMEETKKLMVLKKKVLVKAAVIQTSEEGRELLSFIPICTCSCL